MAPYATSSLDGERAARKSALPAAVRAADDPLEVYYDFVQWVIHNYGEDNPASGLVDLLVEATDTFRNDPTYKSDLRYLKLWVLLAKQRDQSGAHKIYMLLLNNGIGTSLALLYEDCAALLESLGRLPEARKVYRKGIRSGARPLDRLKAKYNAFKERHPDIPDGKESTQPPIPPPTIPNPGTRESRYQSMMMPPTRPGKRPEKFGFEMSLLWNEGTEFCIEEARARLLGIYNKEWPVPPELCPTSMGSDKFHPSAIQAVDFNDNGDKASTKTLAMSRRRSLVSEPTVTINTKEALADVLGMFNSDSPEKTRRLLSMKKVDTSATNTPSASAGRSNPIDFSTPILRTPSGFEPFEDFEDNSPPRLRPQPQTFQPFDENQPDEILRSSVKTPSADRRSENLQPVSQLTEASLRSENARPNAPTPGRSIFTAPTPSKAPLRDSFTEDYGKASAKPAQHVRSKSHHSVFRPPDPDQLPAPVFTRPSDSESVLQTPAAEFPRTRPVFRRPSVENNNRTPFTPKEIEPSSPLNPITPSRAFTPFVDDEDETSNPAPALSSSQSSLSSSKDIKPVSFLPKRGVLAEKVILQEEETFVTKETPHSSFSEEGEEEDYEEDFQYDDDDDGQELVSPHQYDAVPEVEEEPPDGYGFPQDADNPLRRFGQFTVMTPITERTFELTGSVHGLSDFDHDSRPLDFVPEVDDELESDADQAQASPSSEVLAQVEQRTGALSLADSMTRRSNFKPPNPCNPYSLDIQSSLLSFVSIDSHLHDMTQAAVTYKEQLDQSVKKARKTSGSNPRGSGTGVNLTHDIPLTLLDGQAFMVTEKLGEGTFGSVFKAKDLGVGQTSSADKSVDDDDDDDDDLEDEEELASVVALKLVRPRDDWEYHVLRRLHPSLPPRLRDSIILPHALYAFRDESMLVLQYCPHGTLLNIVNKANSAGISQQGACLDELLVFFFSIELVRLVIGMHNAGFIHGDLKIDNCLVRLDEVPGGPSSWQGQYSPEGKDGWKYKGLKIIDFGRAIDTRLFPQGQEFIVDWKGDEKDCVAIQEGRSWRHNADYHGLATIVYTMLFGRHVDQASFAKVEEVWKVSTPFKRYWQTAIWTRLFDVLLNGRIGELDGVLVEMESWLVANCNRTSGTLKGMLKKVELACI